MTPALARPCFSGTMRYAPALTLDRVVIGLLAVFVFGVPTELRIYGELSVTLPAGALALVLGLIGVIWRDRVTAPTAGYVALALFVLWASLGVLWSEYPAESKSRVLIYWQLFAFVTLVTQYVTTRNSRISMFRAYTAGCVWGICDVGFRYATGRTYAGMAGRFSAANTDPNYLALALVIGMPMACYLASESYTPWKKLMYVAYLPAAVFSIVLTGSRGAVMAMAAAGVGVFVASKGRTRAISGCGLLLIAGLMSLPASLLERATAALPGEAAKRFTGMRDELEHGSMANRRNFWKIGLETAAKHPFRGLGAANGDAILSSVRGRTIGLHSLPLMLTTDEGLIGVALFYGSLLLALPAMWRMPVAVRTTLLSAAAAFAVGSMSLNWDIHKATWVLLGLFASAKRVNIARQERTSTLVAMRAWERQRALVGREG